MKRLMVFTFSAMTFFSCELVVKEKSCLNQRCDPPYSHISLVRCNDLTMIDTDKYYEGICDEHEGIEGVYCCEPE